MFNAQQRIRQLMDERGWTIYRLAQESKLSQTTISNIFKRNNQPSIPTVNAICGAQRGPTRSACCIHQDNGIVHNRSALLCGSQQRLSELDWTVSALFYKSKEAYS